MGVLLSGSRYRLLVDRSAGTTSRARSFTAPDYQPDPPPLSTASARALFRIAQRVVPTL